MVLYKLAETAARHRGRYCLMLTCSRGMQFQTMKGTKRTTRARSNARLRFVECPNESRNLNVYTLQMRGRRWRLHVDFLLTEFPVWAVNLACSATLQREGHGVE